MKLSEYAKKNSISYKTAWKMFSKGLIPYAKQLPTGTIVIEQDEENKDTIIRLLQEKIKILEEKCLPQKP